MSSLSLCPAHRYHNNTYSHSHTHTHTHTHILTQSHSHIQLYFTTIAENIYIFKLNENIASDNSLMYTYVS